MTHRALITQMLDVLIQHPTDDGYKDQRWEAILAAREYLAAPKPVDKVTAMQRIVDSNTGYVRTTAPKAPSDDEIWQAAMNACGELYGNKLHMDKAQIIAAFQSLVLDHPAPKAEPVAWMCSNNELMYKGYQRFAATAGDDWNIPVYTHPAPKAEPDDKDLTIAYMAGYHKGKTDAQPKAEPVNQQLLDALNESNSLFAALLHEKRDAEEISEQMASNRAAIKAAEQVPQSVTLTDAEIDAVFDAMPSGAMGFLKGWGYRQFARAVLAAQGANT